MGVYIKGMEMPTTFHCCRMCVQVSDGDIDWHWECCLLCEKVARYATDRIPGCPLVPVPPHGRLIDADAPIKVWEVRLSDGDSCSFRNIETTVSKFLLSHLMGEVPPTIIPAEEE